MCFNEPVTPKDYFKKFMARDAKNPDGWGVAYYHDNSLQLIKEERKATESKLAQFLENYEGFKSKIILGHLRKGSIGSVTRNNAHPFSRELNGKEYAFMHNGNLAKMERDELAGKLSFKPVGQTDSEKAFCYMLNKIKRMDTKTLDERCFPTIENLFKYLNTSGKFNCMLSDGNLLFCYSDIGLKNKMSYLYKKDGNHKGYIISTSGQGYLTEEDWIDFKGGEMKVFKEGKIIY